MAKKTAPHKTSKRHHPEHQLRNILLMGIAFVVVMIIAVGYRQNNTRYQAHVYAPIAADQIPTANAPSDEMHAGACCAAGECLDLSRSDCNSEGYVYWPDADLCLTTCRVTQ